MARNRDDLTGRVFGYWRVLSFAHSDRDGIFWNCECRCATQRLVRSVSLLRGKSTSCGCYRKEQMTRHDRSRSLMYRGWTGMLQRCYNPKAKHYHYYGGKGIKVCERWHDFANFLADMGDRPEGMTLDRRSNLGDYTKDNCRWATRKQQIENRLLNKPLHHKGHTALVSEWAGLTGIPQHILFWRLRHGWTTAAALETPRMNRGPKPKPR